MPARLIALVLAGLAGAAGAAGAQDATYRAGAGHAGAHPGGLAGHGPDGVESMLFVATHPAAGVPAALVALDGEDGALVWRRELEGRPTAPAVAQGLVLVGSDAGGVRAFDVATGEPRWTYETKHAVVGQPVVAGDGAWLGGGEDHLVHALSLADGAKRWTKKVKGEGVFAPPCVRGGSLFAFSATHHAAPVLYALAADDGKVLWSEDKVESTPVTGPNAVELSGEHVIVCVTPDRYRKKSDVTDAGEPTCWVAAFDAASGDERWRAPIGPLAAFGPTVGGETIVCYAKPFAAPPTEAAARHLVALSATDGTLLWSKSIGTAPARWAATSPVVAGDLVLGATSTAVTAFDLRTGEQRWTQPVRSAVIAVAGERGYLVAAGGALTAVDVATGTPRWRGTVQPVASPPPGPPCPGEIAPPSWAD